MLLTLKSFHHILSFENSYLILTPLHMGYKVPVFYINS